MSRKTYDPRKVSITFQGRRITGALTYPDTLRISSRTPPAVAGSFVLRRDPTARDLLRDAQRRSTEGKRTIAPCKHPGEHVIGNYIRCLYGCDGEAVPVKIKPEKTRCLHMRTGEYHYNGKRMKFCIYCKEEWPA